MIIGFHHVGIAVRDLHKAIDFFETTYGAKVIWREKYSNEGFETALVSTEHVRFELLSALDPNSLVTDFIESRGEGIHHMSLEVDRFSDVIDDFKRKGLTVMAETDTKDFRAAFLHPRSNAGVLTEIIEPKGGWGN